MNNIVNAKICTSLTIHFTKFIQNYLYQFDCFAVAVVKQTMNPLTLGPWSLVANIPIL